MNQSPAGWPGISVVIPTWNGLPLLAEYLPSVRAALEDYPGPSECLVVDDGGTDLTARELPAIFPAARYLPRARNEGFAAAANSGFAAARYEHVLLLNNDIRVERDFLRPLAARFRESADATCGDLFAVVSLQINPGSEDDPVNPALDGCRALRFEGGELRMHGVAASGKASRPTALANGGCTLFSRSLVGALGGFCEVFNPAYYEDAELSVQALRRGWQIVFEPGSVVWHRPNSTAKRRAGINALVVRNSFFFQWMLIDSAGRWTTHLAATLIRLGARVLRGDFVHARGLAQALRAAAEVRRHRRARSPGASRSLGQILDEFSDGARKDEAAPASGSI